MTQTLTQRLRERMEDVGMKAKAVAAAAEVGPSFVHDILLGRSTNPTTEKLARVAAVLKTDVGYLLYGTKSAASAPRVENRPRTVSVPFVKVEAAMGGPAIVEAEEQGEPWQFQRSWIRDSLHCRPAGLRLLRVKGDSMEPTLLARDIVMIDSHQVSPTPGGVFVLDDGFGLVAKRLEYIPNSDPPTVRMISDNLRYEAFERTAEEIRIIGRIVWFAREL